MSTIKEEDAKNCIIFYAGKCRIIHSDENADGFFETISVFREGKLFEIYRMAADGKINLVPKEVLLRHQKIFNETGKIISELGKQENRGKK